MTKPMSAELHMGDSGQKITTEAYETACARAAELRGEHPLGMIRPLGYHQYIQRDGLRFETHPLWDSSSNILQICFKNNLIGADPSYKALLSEIQICADATMNVFLTGEMGSGKEQVAKCIHLLSERADEPFLPINCAGIPEQLLESELFGHEKGSFSGATTKRQGIFQ